MRRRNAVDSPRLRELKRRRRGLFVSKALLWCIALGFGFGGLVYLARADFINIHTIEVVGNRVADESLIAEGAREVMRGRYLWLFPKSNILLYPKDQIKEKLGRDFLRLTDIELSIKGSTLQISVDERTSVYIWCGPKPESAEECYFTDKDGFIFEPAPYFSDEVYLKFYGEYQNGDEALGNSVALGNFHKLIDFRNKLETLDLKGVAVHLEDGDNARMLLTSKNIRADNPMINFKLSSDFDEILVNLKTALATEPLATDLEKKYQALEYIDLRFGSKVYYKFR